METDQNFAPADVTIIEFHRFEGISNCDDSPIIYAIETANGIKGTIVDAFGTYADDCLGVFLKKTNFGLK